MIKYKGCRIYINDRNVLVIDPKGHIHEFPTEAEATEWIDENYK